MKIFRPFVKASFSSFYCDTKISWKGLMADYCLTLNIQLLICLLFFERSQFFINFGPSGDHIWIILQLFDKYKLQLTILYKFLYIFANSYKLLECSYNLLNRTSSEVTKAWKKNFISMLNQIRPRSLQIFLKNWRRTPC